MCIRDSLPSLPPVTHRDKGLVNNGPSFSNFAEIFRKSELNAAGPIITFHEVATLVHLIESSKPEARAEGIRLIVLLEVP